MSKMLKINYLDLISAIQNQETIKIIGAIDTNILNTQVIESLYYSLPLIERMVLEIYKLVPEADVEHYEQGTMKTISSIIENNIQVIPENTISLIKDIYGEDGIRNKLLHNKSETISIEVSFEKINFIIMQLLSILKEKLNESSIFELRNITYL
jgi:hypothetical protein